MFAVEVGDGAEVIVMLHGGPGASHDYLRPQMDALAEPGARRLYYYDQRGGGQSPIASGAKYPTAQEHVADLEAIRVALSVEKLQLCGYSWGGLLALLYAVAHPDRVARLALISPAPARAQDRAEANARLLEMSKRPAVEALRAELDAKDRRARFALAVAGYFVEPRRALELTPFLVKQAAADAVWSSLGDYDLLPSLPRVPSLVVHGQEDPIPIASARATAEALGALFLRLDRCGHVPYVEAPDALFAALRSFFGGR
jgi:proline iminopeptidase